jgi:hypothetical protein
MSAAQALKAAREAGVRVGVDGDALTLDADAAPPPAVLELLSRHKPGVIALLLQNDEPRGPQVVVREEALSEANSDNHSERPCSVCGQPARFGYDVYLRRGEDGRWFCAAHRPKAGRA